MDADGRVVEAENSGSRKIDVDEVVGLYRDYVIPLTKDVEVSFWSVTDVSIELIPIGRLPYSSAG